MARNGTTFDIDSVGRSAKRILILVGIIILLIFAGCTSTTRVDAGHVGIRVKLAGSERGIQDMPIVMGWVFYNPISEQVVTFPTSVQNVVSRRARART
jgi:hypothetical protein